MTSLVRPDLKWDPYSTHSWVQYFKNTILCLDFTSHPLDNINAISIFGLNWSLPSQKLQKHHPKAVDVAFLIDFQCVCIFCKYPKSDLVLRKKKRRKKKRHIEYSIYITFAFEVLLNCKPFVCSALNPKPYWFQWIPRSKLQNPTQLVPAFSMHTDSRLQIKIELNYYGFTEDRHFYYQEQCNHKSQQLMTLTPISQSPETVWPTQSQPHAPGMRNRGEYYWIWHPGVQWVGSSHDANSTDHELPELQCCTCHSSKHKVNNTEVLKNFWLWGKWEFVKKKGSPEGLKKKGKKRWRPGFPIQVLWSFFVVKKLPKASIWHIFIHQQIRLMVWTKPQQPHNVSVTYFP